MVKTLYEEIVTTLRDVYPELSLENVIEDIEGAIEKFGIKVKYSDMAHLKSTEAISGYVHVVDGVPEIVVNGFESKLRHRFTMAHELGHALLHWDWLPGNTLPDGLVEVSYRKEFYEGEDYHREQEADSFAAEFLAPLETVIKFLRTEDRNTLDKEYQISLIASHFKISNASAYYRWKDAQGDCLNG